MENETLQDAKEVANFYSKHISKTDSTIISDFKREIEELARRSFENGKFARRDEDLTKGIIRIKTL